MNWLSNFQRKLTTSDGRPLTAEQSNAYTLRAVDCKQRNAERLRHWRELRRAARAARAYTIVGRL